jgi:hypothetical protein
MRVKTEVMDNDDKGYVFYYVYILMVNEIMIQIGNIRHLGGKMHVGSNCCERCEAGMFSIKSFADENGLKET